VLNLEKINSNWFLSLPEHASKRKNAQKGLGADDGPTWRDKYLQMGSIKVTATASLAIEAVYKTRSWLRNDD
jgi:hypothetical protein